MREYSIAVTMESGAFDIIETFEAVDDVAAERYAATYHPDLEWYVLDADGDNINA